MWEYKTIELITLEPSRIERMLNDLGKERWELVSYSFAEQGSTGFAILKRPARRADRRSTGPGRRKDDRAGSS
ncbi:MAG: DUF4177 domain-containing protein [Acidobacteriota bacterium]